MHADVNFHPDLKRLQGEGHVQIAPRISRTLQSA